MNQTNSNGARARRGAGNEPKRKRARDDGRMPTKSHPAQPPGSGRNALAVPGTGDMKAIVRRASDAGVTGAELARGIADPMSGALRIAVSAEHQTNTGGKTLDWGAFCEGLWKTTKKLREGDMSHVEDMLMHQASALQALFVRLTERALGSAEISTMD